MIIELDWYVNNAVSQNIKTELPDSLHDTAARTFDPKHEASKLFLHFVRNAETKHVLN